MCFEEFNRFLIHIETIWKDTAKIMILFDTGKKNDLIICEFRIFAYLCIQK